MDEIPETKIREIREAFELLDKENDGSLRIKDISLVVQSLHLGNEYFQEQISSVMEESGKLNSGKINVDDLITIMSQKYKEKESADEIIEAFKTFDRDGNGTIPAIELKHIMKNLGVRLSEEEVNEIIREADINGDGFIFYEDLVRSMVSE